MCGGCGCGALGICSSNIAYILEKLTSFIALTAVMICIVITLTISIGVGVGLGYNYCFVDMKVLPGVEPPLESDKIDNDLRKRYTDAPNFRRNMPTSTQTQRMAPLPAIKHTMSIPLNGDIDFPSLLSKLRVRNQNVTLELIT